MVLTFDPYYMGESSGELSHISSKLFTENFSARVDYLGLQSFVDREKIAVLGICGSDGFALAVPQVDSCIKAVVTTSMYDMSVAARMGQTPEQILEELRPEHFRTFYAKLRETVSTETKKPLSEYTVEGMHAMLCSILSDAVEGGFLRHNPAWRTYRYAGRKTEKKITDVETLGKIISALEDESIKYETYFKLVIATGMRRGECCALQWSDIDWEQRSIHIRRSAVKVTDEDIFTKAPKTISGDRYVYFSLEMESLLREYHQECAWETETYDGRELENEDFLFRRKGCRLPMTPSTFTWRFKLILKKHGLPEYLNVYSLRHTNASLLIANGTDVATVAGLLGHSQSSTTLDIYTHAFDKNKQAASRVLQEGLEIEKYRTQYSAVMKQ